MRKRARPHQHQIRRAPCSSWRAPPSRYCPGWLGSMRTMRTRAVMLCYSSATLCNHCSISACAPRGAPAISSCRSLSRLDSLKIDSKGRNDFVTDIDRKAEADIIATIRRSHPAARVSRRGKRAAAATANSCGSSIRSTAPPISCMAFPTFAVSIAVEHQGPPAARRGLRPHAPGILHRLARRRRAAGGQENPREHASARLEGALIGTGFPFRWPPRTSTPISPCSKSS